jgi:hypothetical protein
MHRRQGALAKLIVDGLYGRGLQRPPHHRDDPGESSCFGPAGRLSSSATETSRRAP